MRHLLAVILSVASFFALPVTASIQAPRGFAGEMYNSTLVLYGSMNGSTRPICTIEPFERISGGYHLMSAGHCVQTVPMGLQFSVADEINGKLTPVRMMKAVYSKTMDFSEFELKTTKKYTVMTLGDEHDARVGDEVINPNFARAIVKQLSYGRVSSDLVPITDECGIGECAGDFMVQIAGGPGSSGSAVIDADSHQVIGLGVWGFDGTLGLGVEPISNFYKFLAGPGQPHPSEDSEETPGVKIPSDVFAAQFGESHPFTLTVKGPDPQFEQAGYKFKVEADGYELSDNYYYNVPVFVRSDPDGGYSLVSTNEDASVELTVIGPVSK